MADNMDETDHNYDDDNNYDYENDENTTDSLTQFFENLDPGESINNMMDQNNQSDDVNEFSVKNDTHLNLIYRRMLAGQCFRLPKTPTCPDDIFESWASSFLTDLEEDTAGKSRSFRFAWTQSQCNNLDASVPIYHVAKDVRGLISIVENTNLVKKGNIRLVNGSEPTVTNWKECLKLQTFAPVKIKKDESVGITQDIPKTEDRFLKILDGIVNYLTGDFYKSNWGGEPGFITQKYFSEYDKNLKLIKSIYKDGGNTITIDLLDSFKNGTYHNYTATVAAVKRRYKRSHTQETMMYFFRKIDDVLAVDNPTEFKMQHLKTLISTKFLSDKFPVCSDFEGDSHQQKYPEEFNTIIATLLQYITMSHEINRSDWDKVQRMYHQQIKGKVTYVAWHENRSELYRVMDDYLSTKPQRSINQIARNNPRRNQNNRFSQNNRPKPTAPFRQPRAPPRHPAQPPFRPPLPQYNAPRQNQQMQKQNNASILNRLKRLLCMHCSRWAGANRYHHGPWGGGPNSKCPYNRQGELRPGLKFINQINNMNVNEVGVKHYHDIESEGISYVDPCTLNTISEKDNYLIARCLGDTE